MSTVTKDNLGVVADYHLKLFLSKDKACSWCPNTIPILWWKQVLEEHNYKLDGNWGIIKDFYKVASKVLNDNPA